MGDHPTGLRERARVNEVMDWFNTNFHRVFGYGLCYAQILDPYEIPDKNGQAQAVAAADQGSKRLPGILNDHIFGTRHCLCGNAITLADYFASGIVSLGETIGCSFAAWPNVVRWYESLPSLPFKVVKMFA